MFLNHFVPRGRRDRPIKSIPVAEPDRSIFVVAWILAFWFIVCVGGMFAFSGCTTPTQRVALASAEVGNAVATYVLGQHGATAVKGLQDLATALPQIPLGKVSPTQLGVINAELSQIQASAAEAGSAQSQLFSQVGSLISLVSQSTAVSGNPTAETGLILAECIDVQNGIENAIQFWQGQASVTTPAK